MPNLTYQVRRSLAAKTEEYSLTDTELLWPGGSMPFSQIKTVRIYSVPGMWLFGAGKVAFGSRRCAITLDSGAAIELTSQHYLSFGNFEDRSPAFYTFVSALIARVRAANPAAQIVSGMPPMLWWFWFLPFGLLAFLLILCIVLGLLGLSLDAQKLSGNLASVPDPRRPAHRTHRVSPRHLAPPHARSESLRYIQSRVTPEIDHTRPSRSGGSKIEASLVLRNPLSSQESSNPFPTSHLHLPIISSFWRTIIP